MLDYQRVQRNHEKNRDITGYVNAFYRSFFRATVWLIELLYIERMYSKMPLEIQVDSDQIKSTSLRVAMPYGLMKYDRKRRI